MEKLNLFDEISRNQTRSTLMIIFVLLLFIGISWAFSFLIGLGDLGFILILGFFIIYMIYMYSSGDKFVLNMSGAKSVERKEYPFLYDIVEGMAIAHHIPTPKVYIVQDPSPNAFAVGTKPENASIAVTTGLLKTLNNEELEGVISHEISHIANYDVRFLMYTVVMLGAIALLAELGVRIFAGQGSGRRNLGPFALILIVLMVLAPIFGTLVRFALSREREYLADTNGARITRNPEGLAKALEKIRRLKIPTEKATDTTAALYFSNPFPNRIEFLFSTHPPIGERVKRLKSL
ncbi:M48 family metalloprotease [Candidatus Micrarchaeota archaeon]|nr:M48 family metalloprotease [Candidatus Micrarchaeota archaeon]